MSTVHSISRFHASARMTLPWVIYLWILWSSHRMTKTRHCERSEAIPACEIASVAALPRNDGYAYWFFLSLHVSRLTLHASVAWIPACARMTLPYASPLTLNPSPFTLHPSPLTDTPSY